jgi:hypothetical protein
VGRYAAQTGNSFTTFRADYRCNLQRLYSAIRGARALCGSWHDSQETRYRYTRTSTHARTQSGHFPNYNQNIYVRRLHYVTTSTEDNLSCLANNSSTSQNIPCTVWALNSLPSSQDPVSCPYSGPNRVHGPSPNFPKPHFKEIV